ncbi:MAG: glycosyltransferase [Tepidisphaeraceae bacterium]|jgi:glycosyltransferase involved in cell wall biosynthesis
MHVLFIHQNFPAQFRFIAPRLAKEGWRCTFATEREEGELEGVEKILYKPRGGATPANHLCTRNFENTVAHAHGVFEGLKSRRDLNPDLVVAHCGFGSSLFVPFLWDAPIINFFEFFYHATGQDLGFRPEMPIEEVNLLRSRTNNAMILLDWVNCDRGWTPTHYQRDFFPPELRSKIDVIFDGIDTDVYFRRENVAARIRAEYKIPDDHRIVTYVARGFEMMRGFDIFMKAAQRIYQQNEKVTFLVVGTDRVHYGGDLKFIKEKTFRHHVLNEGNYDLSRFRFTGFVQPPALAEILSAADAHIYLTEPFIASWSLVNAMSCGAVVVASDQSCVREYITPGENGLLENFFDFEAIAGRVLEILSDPPAFAGISQRAMETVREKYSLDVALPRIKTFFEEVAGKRRQPKELLEDLLHKGTLEMVHPEIQPPSADAIAAPLDADSMESVTAQPSELEQAATQIKRLSAVEHSPANWPRVVMNYHGPAGVLESIGPVNHPTDLARLLTRLGQWNAQTILDLGSNDVGIIFLWTRVAAPNARIILAQLADRPMPEAKVQMLPFLPRPKQEIHRLTPAENVEAMESALDKSLDGRQLDFVFMNGRRTYKDISNDFRRLRRRVRAGGLIGWDGVTPIMKSSLTDGGDRLWTEVRPLYPNRAEYLEGRITEVGGIALIKV